MWVFAAHHGRGEDPHHKLHLNVAVMVENGLLVRIEDDGVGLEATRISNGGSGRGLVLHSTMLAIMGGSLDLESTPGAYTRVTLSLPQQILTAQKDGADLAPEKKMF